MAVACAPPATLGSASPSATTSPTATPARSTAPQASTPPSPSPSPVSRPGLLTRRGDGPIGMRPETDTTPVRIVPSRGLSPDGRQLAYWSEAGGAQLHVMDIGGTDRVIASFPDRRPGGMTWSTDGAGILVSTADNADPRFLIARVLTSVDVATGATRQIYTATGPSGASIIPLVWRRVPEIYAAYETGPGGYSFGYTVIRPGQPAVRTDPEGQAFGFAASADGAAVLGMWLQEGVVKEWPVEDFSKATELRPTAGEQFANPRWWPDRREIALAVGRHVDIAFVDVRIERWDPASGARVVLKRLPDNGNLGGYFIRADGSGVLTQGPYPPGAWEVTDLRTGSSSAVPQLEGEIILDTVVIR